MDEGKVAQQVAQPQAYLCTMYSRQEASKIKQQFWTVFGQYMQPVLSAEGEKMQWVNYKTGEPHISFKMDADSKSAMVAIVLTHKDKGLRELYFQQFMELRKLLSQALEEDWTWRQHATESNGKEISRIFICLENVSIFSRDDWPAIIAFLKKRIIALDAFWSEARYAFESLR